MSEYATNGAGLKCSCGSAPSKLQVISNTLYSVQGQLVATTSDKAPMVNIKPFGTCALKPTISGYAPCIPAPTVWAGFINSVQIPGGNPLLKTSTIQCACGGLISFQDSGQMKGEKVVLNPSSPQISVLKKAAIDAIPFCEECEKKEKKIQPQIVNIFWIDEESDEPHELSELEEGKEVTLCVEVEEGGAGKTVDLQIQAPKGKTFKGNKSSLDYKGISVEEDNTGYIDMFKVEYDEQ